MTIYTTPRPISLALETFRHSPMPFGGSGGYSTSGEALINVTADGVDLNVIWQEAAAVAAKWNAERSALTSLLTFSTTNTADAIPQSRSQDSFEQASEFGQPESMRPPADYALMGYTFTDYDKASRWTRFFVRDSTAEQVRAILNYALEADNRLTTGTILQRLLDPTQGENEWSHPVYGMFNGDDSMIPSAYLGKEFSSGHNHYLVSGSDTIDSGDLETAIRNVTEHGYGTEPNSRLLALMNPTQAESVASFKAGVENATGIFAKHDYIPSAGAPAYLQPENIVGQVAPESYNGLKVNGSYGPVWIVESQFIPEDYFTVVATYGPNSPDNAIGFREHVQAQYRGFRTIPGTTVDYPLIDSFFTRAFGVGARRRGQACITQLKGSGEYDIPNIPK
ncbi:hypothetical protein [Mycobacterium sp. D16R24]|uniref:hypothetical protein n=1 Tax=Mycobacterium sp. D16R24 TaxID=1855656 RepID=UPI00099421CC|nr:hypothetical protein [Mycobacterium sp. D16R24]